jgi:succinyl-CoA synthetase beta subunit
MYLHEYQAKKLFSAIGIPTPQGVVVASPGEAYEAAKDIGGPVVVKAQVLASRRGSMAGIRLARTPDQARQAAETLLGREVGGMITHKVLVDPALDIAQEIYLAIVTDRSQSAPVIIASDQGGAQLEIAQGKGDPTFQERINPLIGLRDYQIRNLANGIQLPREHWKAFLEIARNLWVCFNQHDATLAEMNPLAITTQGRLVALDCKIAIDDNALFRHPEIIEMRDMSAEHRLEIRAREVGLTYVRMEGSVACMVNGAGMGMATTDMVKAAAIDRASQHGPACFVDIGGGARADKVAAGLRIILADLRVRAILINIFGGITRADEVAKGILQVNEVRQVPLVVRLVGTNAGAGQQILRAAEFPNLKIINGLWEATETAVIFAGSRG